MKSALLIEDDEGVIQAVSTSLIGYVKKAAHTMTDAIAALQANEFDVVFLDLSLPDSSPSRTLEMLPMLRMLAKDSAIIIMTGHPAAIGNGSFAVDSILTKPFHSGHVREALADANLALERNRCVVDPTAQMCRAILAFP
jgi:ActR/RegA family two-component response regulator